MTLPEIVITEEDFDALCSLIERAQASQRAAADRLDREVARARIVPSSEVGSDVVTMNTRLVVEELTSDAPSRVVTVVYPEDAAPEEGRISVLSPLGCALLGLRVGQTIEWSVPARPTSRYRVGTVLYQPQAASAREKATG